MRYNIVAGDTLYSIADKLGLNASFAESIANYNDPESVINLLPGEYVIIPDVWAMYSTNNLGRSGGTYSAPGGSSLEGWLAKPENLLMIGIGIVGLMVLTNPPTGRGRRF